MRIYLHDRVGLATVSADRSVKSFRVSTIDGRSWYADVVVIVRVFSSSLEIVEHRVMKHVVFQKSMF